VCVISHPPACTARKWTDGRSFFAVLVSRILPFEGYVCVLPAEQRGAGCLYIQIGGSVDTRFTLSEPWTPVEVRSDVHFSV